MQATETETFRKCKMPFTVPEFPNELATIEDYQQMTDNAFIILSDRQKRMETLLEMDFLPPQIDEDVRSARGKVMILANNKLKKFRELTKTLPDNEQSLNDLSGFWSMCVTELYDLKRSCDLVEQYHNNNWQPLGKLSGTFAK